MLTYPQIDPVIFSIGPIQPRWYGMMYLLGFIYTFFLLKKHAKWIGFPVEAADNVLASLVLGLIVTARIVYVLFYNLSDTLAGPWWEFLAIWHGGLAFHGGLLGVILGSHYVSRKYNLKWQRLYDVLALATPVGLGLGRIANFINGELWGRVTNVPWAMVFPGAGPNPRHPSQLYEAFLEGLVLFIILRIVWWRKPKVGVVAATFLLCYAAFRMSIELVREPDAQVGFIFGFATMGQLLSLAMVAYGAFLMWHSLTHGEPHDTPAPNLAEKVAKKRKKK